MLCKCDCSSIIYFIIGANIYIILFCIQRRGSKKKNVKRTEAPKDIKGEVPIIVCRRKEFNFYEGQEYSKYKPIPLVSKGWHHYKSKGDYFYIYPLTNVHIINLLSFHYYSPVLFSFNYFKTCFEIFR